MKKKSITANEFDTAFDAGVNIAEHLDLSKAKRPGIEQHRVTVDFPAWMVNQLDSVAKRLGIPRQSVIKVFISEKLKESTL
jgi:hypothetical protein